MMEQLELPLDGTPEPALTVEQVKTLLTFPVEEIRAILAGNTD